MPAVAVPATLVKVPGLSAGLLPRMVELLGRRRIGAADTRRRAAGGAVKYGTSMSAASPPAGGPAPPCRSGAPRAPASLTSRVLRDQQHLAGRPAALEGAVGLGGVAEGEFGADPDLELAGGEPAEEIAGAGGQLLAGGDVVEKGGAGEEQRAVGGQAAGIDRRHRAARLAEQRHQAARRQAGESLVEGGTADAVVHHLQAVAAGGARDLGLEDRNSTRL